MSNVVEQLTPNTVNNEYGENGCCKNPRAWEMEMMHQVWAAGLHDAANCFQAALEPEYMTPWKAEQLMSVRPQTMYTAYDTMDDYEHLRAMADMLHNAGLSWKSHQVKCYLLCGYPEDSMDAAEKRAKQIMGLGFLPFAMLYRDETGSRDQEWRKFQREWANAVIVGRKFADFWTKKV